MQTMGRENWLKLEYKRTKHLCDVIRNCLGIASLVRGSSHARAGSGYPRHHNAFVANSQL